MGPIPAADAEAARRVIFGAVDGLGEKGKRQWRRLWASIFRLEPGEIVEIVSHKARSGPFHRRHMAMEQALFEAQERFEQFRSFRDWLKVGAGHVEWFPGPKGGVIPVPNSISYAELEDNDMREVHVQMVRFLRTEHAQRTLWPGIKDPVKRADAMNAFLMGFDEWA
ncbi:DUF1367 family protein [Comamonas serinivorans]|nr:DUF1367 family protein [Comamonas serinivorans]